MNHKIFVYGSLKRGFYNHKRWMQRATFLGEAKLFGFKLYSLGPYPAIKEEAVPSHSVYGELFEVDDHTKQQIDWMEKGAGYMVIRKPFLVNGKKITADVYIYRGITDERNFIESGVWVQKVE